MKKHIILLLTFLVLPSLSQAEPKPIDITYLQKDVDPAIESLAANLSEVNPQVFDQFYQDLQREASLLKGQLGQAPSMTVLRKIWRLQALGEVAGYAALAKKHVTGRTVSTAFESSDAEFWRSNRVLWQYAANKSSVDPNIGISIRIFVKERFMKRHPSIIPYFNSFE